MLKKVHNMLQTKLWVAEMHGCKHRPIPCSRCRQLWWEAAVNVVRLPGVGRRKLQWCQGSQQVPATATASRRQKSEWYHMQLIEETKKWMISHATHRGDKKGWLLHATYWGDKKVIDITRNSLRRQKSDWYHMQVIEETKVMDITCNSWRRQKSDGYCTQLIEETKSDWLVSHATHWGDKKLIDITCNSLRRQKSNWYCMQPTGLASHSLYLSL